MNDLTRLRDELNDLRSRVSCATAFGSGYYSGVDAAVERLDKLARELETEQRNYRGQIAAELRTRFAGRYHGYANGWLDAAHYVEHNELPEAPTRTLEEPIYGD